MKDRTCSKVIGLVGGDPVKVVYPVLASCDMSLDFFSDSSSLWFEKKILVMSMRALRAAVDLPRMIISSAKNMAEMLVLPRSRPIPVELSSVPRLLMYKLNRRGERLQPNVNYTSIFMVITHKCITLFYPSCKPKLVRVFTIN